MSTLATKGNWNITKGKFKQKISQLTDDELQFFDGREDELIDRIQKRPGQARGKTKQLQDEAVECYSSHC